LLYVFEYSDEAMQRMPERNGPLTLGPEQSWECLGESRMVRWRDGGRVFQAHVYLGPRASDGLRQDAASIVSSIQPR
jgi:hypothetical protein